MPPSATKAERNRGTTHAATLSRKKPSRMSPQKKPAKKAKAQSETSETTEEASAAYEEPNHDSEDDTESLHSDDLDDELVQGTKKRRKSENVTTPKKRARRAKAKSKDEEGYNHLEDEDLDANERRQVVGKVVSAPTTGRVPPGRISENTLNFLRQLMDPKCNDREWFRLHEPVYRLAEKEWTDFVEKLMEKITEIDDEVPPLPAKDAIHRIYRDIRFSNDKTPYKTNLSASFSRSGRKGIFAGYHVCVRPGGGSLIAAGVWCPGKNETATIRSNILRDPSRLREVIGNSEFVKLFGSPKPHPKGERQNVFGGEDELKVAPKGIDKNHPDIDLLKLRSIAVVHRFLDSEVLDPAFMDNFCQLLAIVRPLVRLLNNMMTVSPESDAE